MKFVGIFFIIFGLAVVIYENLLVYLIGGFFIFMGLNILFIAKSFSSKQNGKENYVKFGNYKIYR
ncbi:hypothetical protein CSB08_00305 [Candidatus Gracilibacteria bacterium]|nr:MAG: hypothetical protein CSB08_00305 [Candidatus Gracilibacteria bacterium]PIE85284.1 MAG: hypothetical protein CSA08_02655 [Candidatus Gracilibacteria bacterium]